MADRVTSIDWLALLPRCTEAIKPRYRQYADSAWDSEYRLSLYALVEPFIPRATVAAYAAAELEMSDARESTVAFDDDSPRTHAFEALKHVLEMRALRDAPAEDLEDVAERLLYAAEIQEVDAFPEACVALSDLLRTSVADLRRLTAMKR